MSMPTKKRVLLMTYAIDNRPGKATASVARRYAETLLSHPDEFELTFAHYERVDDPLYQRGAQEVIFPTFRFRLLNRRSLRQIYYFITTRDRYDIVHWFQPRLYPFFWLVPARYIFVTVHGGGDVTAPGKMTLSRRMFNMVVRTMRRKIDAAIVVSRFAKQEVQEAYGFEEKQIFVISNGIDERYLGTVTEEMKKHVREKYGLPEHFILSVSRLVAHKNVPFLMRSFEKYVAQTGDQKTFFVNVGQAGGDDSLHVQQTLAKSHASALIRLISYVENEDMPALYALADAFVFPSLNEGQGMPVLEAMACGTPVIASNAASLPEVCGDAAILVDPTNEQEMASALDRVLHDEVLREQLRKQGKIQVQKYTWSRAEQQLLDVYRGKMEKE